MIVEQGKIFKLYWKGKGMEKYLIGKGDSIPLGIQGKQFWGIAYIEDSENSEDSELRIYYKDEEGIFYDVFKPDEHGYTVNKEEKKELEKLWDSL